MLNIEQKAREYALKNAVAYNGKAQQGAVISGLFNEGLKKEDLSKHLKTITNVVNEINSLSPSKQNEEYDKIKENISKRHEREGLPEIPNTKNGIITRFAPAPSGGLHIGHAISNVIPYLYFKKYGGKFYIRIEDTNPEKTDAKAYDMIKSDCDWLFPENSGYVIQSDRMRTYYKYAEDLIKKKHAYVCECSSEEFKKFVDSKTDCPCRSKSVSKNLEDWKKMLDKNGFGVGKALLRFKTSDKEGGMKHPNPAMRDFPLARINTTKHPRQGNKYRVWPLMNLAVPTDDIEMKISHIIRGKDHMDNAKKQKMFYDAMNKSKKFPWTFFMGRMKFLDMNLGKRFIKASIESGEFSGWDDEKLPTLSSLRKRGYKPEAFYGFSEQRGLTDVDKVINSKDFFKILDNFNRSP